MKSAGDPRHKRRRQAVKELFANSFSTQKIGDFANLIMEHKDQLDLDISKSAPQWPIDKLNKIDLAILRLATYEYLFTDTPDKVIVDEAVELAKEFGGESSAPFVNGVLGNILKTHSKQTNDSK